MCVLEGMAFCICVLMTYRFTFVFYAIFSQTPGPVLSTVLIPDRKSGMPQAVLIPALFSYF
jgi:hypothetical protein